MLFSVFNAILSRLKHRSALQCKYRCVAQLGRALRSGRRGRRFKSCRIDFLQKAGNTEKIKVSGLFLFLEQACKSVRKVCLRMFVKCVLRFVLKNVLKFGLVISKMAYEKSVHYIEKPIATFTDYRFYSFILNFLFV